ncbi:MAG: hypothetical protein Q9221_008999 [Calogaya cf. arnoldii]
MPPPRPRPRPEPRLPPSSTAKQRYGTSSAAVHYLRVPRKRMNKNLSAVTESGNTGTPKIPSKAKYHDGSEIRLPLELDTTNEVEGLVAAYAADPELRMLEQVKRMTEDYHPDYDYSPPVATLHVWEGAPIRDFWASLWEKALAEVSTRIGVFPPGARLNPNMAKCGLTKSGTAGAPLFSMITLLKRLQTGHLPEVTAHSSVLTEFIKIMVNTYADIRLSTGKDYNNTQK